MENLNEAKNLITQAKSIYILPADNANSKVCALALFYTLKELGKNVNLVIDSLPENLSFLSPSLDFISYPKNFVISIPESVAKVSQIYYEKSPGDLKIHLSLESGNIKKDNVAFYFSEPKPDLVISVGVQDYAKELSSKLDSYGFLLDSEVLNIDNSNFNKNFGKINLITEKPLFEAINALIEKPNKQASDCLLTSLVIKTSYFKENLSQEVFQMTADLMKNGADLLEITKNLGFTEGKNLPYVDSRIHTS